MEDSLIEVSEATWQRLAAEARVASAHAYCRYSMFRVGAAALSRDGAIARGCNVENASYGLTTAPVALQRLRSTRPRERR